MNIVLVSIIGAVAYCFLGAGVYRLCRSSSVGTISSVPISILLIWPIILAVVTFKEE